LVKADSFGLKEPLDGGPNPATGWGNFFGISDPLESIAKHRYWEFGKRARPAKALNGK